MANGFITKLRKKFAWSFLMQHADSPGKSPKPINLETAKSVALLYYLPDEETYKKAEAFLARLNDYGLKTRVIAYSDLKVKPHYFIPKISQDLFTDKEINWRFQPNKPFVKEFIETEYDLLIDLSLDEKLPLLYLSALSHASLKVGRYLEEHEKFYDLMIHTATDETLESFSEQILHYLGRINT